MCKYFYPCGIEMSDWKEFVKFYSNLYYLDCDTWIVGISQNSRHVEDIIEGILKAGIKNNRDVLRVLAWKMGKINHEASDMLLVKSNKNCYFVYDKEWKDAEEWEKRVLVENNPNLYMGDLVLKNRGGNLEISQLVDYVVKNADKLYEDFKTNPQKVLDNLNKQKSKGIGTVYMITLLYFLSRGDSPIYDQFADRALKAICCEPENLIGNSKESIKPGDKIDACKLPDKNSKRRFGNVYGDYIEEFIERIRKAFDSYENYKENRDIDRALWVYGHLFLPMQDTIVKDKINIDN